MIYTDKIPKGKKKGLIRMNNNNQKLDKGSTRKYEGPAIGTTLCQGNKCWIFFNTD